MQLVWIVQPVPPLPWGIVVSTNPQVVPTPRPGVRFLRRFVSEECGSRASTQTYCKILADNTITMEATNSETRNILYPAYLALNLVYKDGNVV